MSDNEKRVDLVQKFADRLKGAGERKSLAERAMEKLAGPVPPPVEDAIEIPPLPQLDTAPFDPPPQQPRRTAADGPRLIQLDNERLRRSGYITTNALERSRLAEEFRVIKRPLLRNAMHVHGEDSGVNGRVIMVTSARPGEGKTFTAINLAMSLTSEQDLRVLLVDCDVHKQDLPGRLGVTAEKGLVDLLVDEQLPLDEVILQTDVPNLSILPSGFHHSQTTELMASQRMARLVGELGGRNPNLIIVVDTPPVLARSEAGVMAQHVGQTLMVVEEEKTTRRALERALALIEPCQQVSFMLNKTRFRFDAEDFGSYYDYDQGDYDK